MTLPSGEGSTEAVATTTEGSTAKEEQEAEEFKGLVMIFIMFLTTRAITQFQVNIMLRLTNSGHLPANLTKEDFEKRIVRISFFIILFVLIWKTCLTMSRKYPDWLEISWTQKGHMHKAGR